MAVKRTIAQIFSDAGDPVPVDELQSRVQQQESGGNPDAVSKKGAVGTMQTLPSTLKDPGYGVTPAADDSDAERTRVGQDYLKAMLEKYNGNQPLALAAYNHGPGNVDDWRAAGGDPSKLPAETRGYITNILGDTKVAPEEKTPPNASQAVLARSHTFDVNGVQMTVDFPGSREEAAQFLGEQVQARPDLIPTKAAEQGLKFDWKTGQASEYGTVEKLRIGAGHSIESARTGAVQLLAEIAGKISADPDFLAGNAGAIQASKDRTDEENALYNYINKPGSGLNATDIGSVVAAAPLLWGGGLFGMAAKLGIIDTVQAQGNADTGESRAIEGAQTAAGAAVGGAVIGGVGKVAGFTISKIADKVGWGNLGQYATSLLLDTAMGTGGLATAARYIRGGFGGDSSAVAGRGAARSEDLSSWDRTGHAGPPGHKAVQATALGRALSMAREWMGGMDEIASNRANQALAKIAMDVQAPDAAILAKEELARRATVTLAKRAAKQRADAEKLVDDAVAPYIKPGTPEYLRRPPGATNENLTPPRVPRDRMQRPSAGGIAETFRGETPLIESGVDIGKLGAPRKGPGL